ncbi:hypothetical protein [Mycobacterium shinjukuense]|uniref:Uncharacterized protein n=1 Tax=Mycobacterium shinjukuense TaxID=398694 RepID=A0A7I7MNM3_9MYCO|nr:hypothetical protein [Mycobacterium shinjukuense]BBX73745.1 hypothetical protein MSHI_16510 [Mycobacterium shinjukuense]
MTVIVSPHGVLQTNVVPLKSNRTVPDAPSVDAFTAVPGPAAGRFDDQDLLSALRVENGRLRVELVVTARSRG